MQDYHSILDPDTEKLLRGVMPPADLPLSQTANPYWDIVRTIPGNGIDWRYDHIFSPDWSSTWRWEKPVYRDLLCIEYSWAIPDPASLDFLTRWLSPAVVEMGAGNGYWCWQLSQLGIECRAYDEKPPDSCTDNHWCSPRVSSHGELNGTLRPIFFPVQAGTPDVLAQHPDRTLFLCWPPMSDMAAHCLKAYQGNRLVYIGEGSSGCTADETFYELLEAHWEEVAEHRPVQWWAIHDWITVYERKR